jgi:lipid-binding SYLF domain-containing protein
MKTVSIALLMAGFTGAALALDQAELDRRIQTLCAKFEVMQSKTDRCIPADTLRKAHGIVLLDRTKAGFLFAYQGGGGVAMVRDAGSDQWSPAAFLGANEASLGFQVGGQQAFFVILLMNTNATRLLTEPNFEFGGEARGVAADSTAGVQGVVNSTEQSVLIFDDRKGLYGGAAIKGGAIAPDDKANQIYYGRFLSMREILFEKKVEPTEAAQSLAQKIKESSKLAAR